MKIFAEIINNILNVGPLTDPAGCEGSRVDLVAVLLDYKTVQYGCEVGGKEDMFRPENWGKDVAFRPLQHCLTSLSQVQANLTSDTETTDINSIKWLEKIKKLAEHNAQPPAPLPKKMKMKTSRNPVINF